ncbi:MAG: endolytic transglycosylase MltG, partial [Traorella sp.]
TDKDIADKIAQITNVSAKECLDLWNDETFLNEMIQKYEFLDNSIFNKEYHVKLEGYLYPNSYYIYKETTPQEITIKLLDGFNTVYTSLKEDIQKSDYTLHEIVTFASVVQFESSNVSDMPIISSIFYNRFEAGMKMGASATVCYALYDGFDDIMDCETNANYDSPYNTYLYQGLPIGPINNPSIDAIKAVLHPKDTDYYYFISDIYGDGKLIPAKTYEEHLKNIKKYLR